MLSNSSVIYNSEKPIIPISLPSNQLSLRNKKFSNKVAPKVNDNCDHVTELLELLQMGNNVPKPKTSQDFLVKFRKSPLALEGESDEVAVHGNCPRPWSDHVYMKLFLDVEGCWTTLMVLKCEVTCVNLFTDVETTLYKSRFIGGKNENICEMLVFDLMKSSWETSIPELQAVELNVDVVMSASPSGECCDTLLKMVQLERKYLKSIRFEGKLDVNVRFAHGYEWNSKDEEVKKETFKALKSLHEEEVKLEVMDSKAILEEMRVDRISLTNEELANQLIRSRFAWKPKCDIQIKINGKKRKPKPPKPKYDVDQRTVTVTSSSESEMADESDDVFENDMYFVHVHLLEQLDEIVS